MRSTSRGAVSQSVRILYHGLHVMVTISLKKYGGSWLPVGVWMIRRYDVVVPRHSIFEFGKAVASIANIDEITSIIELFCIEFEGKRIPMKPKRV